MSAKNNKAPAPAMQATKLADSDKRKTTALGAALKKRKTKRIIGFGGGGTSGLIGL
jgi:hypothetical protein